MNTDLLNSAAIRLLEQGGLQPGDTVCAIQSRSGRVYTGISRMNQHAEIDAIRNMQGAGEEVFKTSTIYRTGSDEFVVVLDGSSPDNKAQNVSDNMAEAMSRLSERHTTPTGKASFRFKAGYVKKTGKVNTSIITILKDMITTNSGAAGQIIYNDLDR